jgi:hypothetical protein
LNSNVGINLGNTCIHLFLVSVAEVVLKDGNGFLNTFRMISELLLDLLLDFLLGLFLDLVLDVIPPREETVSGFVGELVLYVIDPLVGLVLNLCGYNISVLIDTIVDVVYDVVCSVILDFRPERGFECNLAVGGHPVGLFINPVNNHLGGGDHDVNVRDVRQNKVDSGIDGTRNNLVFVINDLVPDFLGNLTANVGGGVFNFTANMGAGVLNFTANVLRVVNKAGVGSHSEGGCGNE